MATTANHDPRTVIPVDEHTWMIPSATTPGVFYKVERHQHADYSCTCKSFVYRLRCGHVAAVKERIALDRQRDRDTAISQPPRSDDPLFLPDYAGR